MASGWMYQGRCMAVLQDAVDNYFQYQTVSVTQNGTSTILQFYSRQASGVWNNIKHTYNGTGVLTQNYSVPVANPFFAVCTVDATTTTGGTVGTGVPATGSFNYTEASAMWAFAFITVLMHWFLAKKVGFFLNAIRRF
jgi:hypothetical protein